MWQIPLPDIEENIQRGKAFLARIPWRLVLEIALVVILCLALLSAWRGCHRPQAVGQNTQYVRVPEEKVVTRIQRVAVPGPERIVTIEKQAVAERLDMPWLVALDQARTGEQPPVAGNPADLQVTADADIPPSKGGMSTVAVLNMATGETTIVAKEKPLPLFAIPSEGELGIRYGLRSEGLQGGNLYGRWTFFRVGNFHLAAYGEIDTRPEAKAMLDLSYRF